MSDWYGISKVSLSLIIEIGPGFEITMRTSALIQLCNKLIKKSQLIYLLLIKYSFAAPADTEYHLKTDQPNPLH